MKIKFCLVASVLLLSTSVFAKQDAGRVVKIGDKDTCRYIVDGIPQTKYCTSAGVKCASDGTCTVSSLIGADPLAPVKIDTSIQKNSLRTN